MQEVVRLHEHVRELGVRDALLAILEPRAHGLLRDHRVDARSASRRPARSRGTTAARNQSRLFTSSAAVREVDQLLDLLSDARRCCARCIVQPTAGSAPSDLPLGSPTIPVAPPSSEDRLVPVPSAHERAPSTASGCRHGATSRRGIEAGIERQLLRWSSTSPSSSWRELLDQPPPLASLRCRTKRVWLYPVQPEARNGRRSEANQSIELEPDPATRPPRNGPSSACFASRASLSANRSCDPLGERRLAPRAADRGRVPADVHVDPTRLRISKHWTSVGVGILVGDRDVVDGVEVVAEADHRRHESLRPRHQRVTRGRSARVLLGRVRPRASRASAGVRRVPSRNDTRNNGMSSRRYFANRLVDAPRGPSPNRASRTRSRETASPSRSPGTT